MIRSQCIALIVSKKTTELNIQHRCLTLALPLLWSWQDYSQYLMQFLEIANMELYSIKYYRTSQDYIVACNYYLMKITIQKNQDHMISL